MEVEQPTKKNLKDAVTAASVDFTPTSFKSLGKKEGTNLVGQDVQSKIEEAARLKQEGNVFFKAHDYKKAISSYNKALMYVNGLVGTGDTYYQYSSPSSQLSNEQLQVVKDLKISTYLNISQIDLYNKNYSKCIERATKALDIFPSAKGFYRRGIANAHLNEFERARQDYTKCLELDPSLKEDITQKLQELKQAEKIADKKSAGFYSKMFS